ncbi:MAG: hypothetical protein LBT44_05340 [Clostridiales bacterium]|nr:hypothetical protein [Clostridiales bacterium]
MISGKAQHGKDTTAQFLGECMEMDGLKALRVAFADYVKFICAAYYHWTGEKDEAGRQLLQFVSTELFRARDTDFWADTVIRFLKILWNDYDYALIPDFRFPNEFFRWQEFGVRDVVTVRVERPGFENNLTREQRQHASETSLDNFPFDYRLAAEDVNALEKQCARLFVALKSRIIP